MTGSQVTAWDAAVGTGALRIAVGAGLLRFSRPLIRLSGGSPDDPWLRGLFTYFGVRDIALGVSAVAASRPGSDVRRQLYIQGGADLTDAALLSALVSAGRFPRVRGTALAALALGTAVTDVLIAGRVDADVSR